MQELTSRQITITDSFWSPRLAVNAEKAIFHQWEQLEATACLDNFRIAAGEKDGFREGWVFADSDAYKWLDAASRISALHTDLELASTIDALIALLARAQMPDGYLFTYNQIHFPGQRWVNLQIEHELYCHGHLIESELPWKGQVHIHIQPAQQREFAIHWRKPSWDRSLQAEAQTTASGYDPRQADYVIVTGNWSPQGETVEFDFDMSIQLRRAHPKVRGHAGKVAVTRGPLVYCLESVDNPNLDIFTAQLDPSSLHDKFVSDLLGGIVIIHGKTTDGQPLKLIPYFLWANRGPSQMTVWVNSRQSLSQNL